MRITPPAGYSYGDLEWSHGPVTVGAADPYYALACARRDTAGVFALKITLLAAPADPADLAPGVSGAGVVVSTGSVDRVNPTWSPDDSRLAYQDLDDRSLYSVAVDGTDEVLELDADDLPPSIFNGVNFPRWHPTDADRIAFHHGGTVYVFHRSTGSYEEYSPMGSRSTAAWTRDGDGLVYVEGQSNLTLLCDEELAIESTLFSLPGAGVYFIRMPRTQAAIDVLDAALANP